MDEEFAQGVLDDVEEVRMNILVGFEKVMKSDDGKWAFIPTKKWEDIHEILQLQCTLLENFAKEYLGE